MDQAAAIPLVLNTAALGLYCGPSGERSGAGLTPPWEEGGRGKYTGQPCLVFGGTSSVGQFGMHGLFWLSSPSNTPSCSYPVCQAVRLLTNYHHGLRQEHRVPAVARRYARP